MDKVQEEAIVQGFRELVTVCHQQSRDKGFWDRPRNQGEMYMLMVTELAEGFENGIRKGKQDDHLPDYTSEIVEMVDLIIRACDWIGGYCGPMPVGKDSGNVLLDKLEFNRGRDRLHGKRF